MKIQQCVNGHFFDVDSYRECPHCGAPVAGAVSANEKKDTKGKKRFLFSKKSKEEETVIPQQINNDFIRVPNMNIQNPVNANRGDFGNPGNFGVKPSVISPTQKAEDLQPVASPLPPQDKTLDFWSSSVVKSEKMTGKGLPDVDIADIISTELKTETEINHIEQQKEIEPEKIAEFDNHKHEENFGNIADIKNEIRKVSANDEGKTMSYFSLAFESKAREEDSAVKLSDPVVGWFIAIKGNHIGESFSVFAGKNSVGRNSENRIVLSKDSAVSRSKHALVIFEPKKKKFYLQPGESNGLIYLNEDYISESKELKKRDIVELGESKLMFVPLCDESFAWEDYIK